MSDFLLELRSEEIPARMQAGARASLEKLFREQMAAAGVAVGEVTVWSTPRRLALIAHDLPQATQAVSEEVKGPRISAPAQALEGFLRKTGLTQNQLSERDGVWFAVTETPGRQTRDVLAAAIPAMIRAFPWPKSQRWGTASISTESLRWVRPLSGIVAIFGEDLVECEVGGIKSGYATRGHRFHAPGEITIGGAHDYADKLRLAHVLVDHTTREGIIRDKARAAAAEAGLTLVEDEGLVIENAGLTEWPVPLLGRFDEAFLDVPPEVIQLTARTNQKYFVCTRAPANAGVSGSSAPTPEVPASAGALANAFVCTANIEAADGGVAIVAGNRKVLAARLSDARFFWDQDRKKPLSVHAEGLARITFHEKLGTVADKVERVAKLARWLVEEGIVTGADASLAEQAVRLCKADLVTEMVGEFPELQGLMGGYYARAEGLPDAVADAIRDHYKPVGQGDDVPTAPVTVAVSLADKLDTLRSFFAIDEKPTGSKDPFALRRAALGIIRTITDNGLRLPLDHGDLLEFFADRLKVQQREAGVRHDLIDAVFALGGENDLVRLLARVHALQAFVGTEDGKNLLAGYKRAANILKKEGFDSPLPLRVGDGGVGSPAGSALDDSPNPNHYPEVEGLAASDSAKTLSYTLESAETALVAALDAVEPEAAAAVAAEDFAVAMAALAGLRGPIDAFFDTVTVNDADPAKRAARLALLARFRDAVHRVADFSRIEG